MEKLCKVGLVILVFYSLALLGLEAVTGEQYAVRRFFADITDPSPKGYPFYAVNTTISVFLLWSYALLFAVGLSLTPDGPEHKRERKFAWSQIILFIYLGMDDRFLFHEGLHDYYGVHEALLFGFLGMSQMYFLLDYGNILQRSRKNMILLFWAGFFFAIMFIADIFMDNDAYMRLSVEDLAKTWSAVFLFLFAWNACHEKIQALKDPQKAQT